MAAQYYFLFAGLVNVPPERPLPGTNGPNMEFVMIADEAFPLQTNLLRPFPGRDAITIDKKRYNYRLSRARRVIENAFGQFITIFVYLGAPVQ